jgi:ADP-ribose pyrophosphatase
MKPHKIISRKIIFRGNFFNIVSDKVKLPNKRIVNWHIIDWTHDSVVIVPIDDKNNVYLSKEWRTAWKKKIIIIPAGGVKTNAKEEENTKQAHNELREEIGFDAKKIEKLATVLDQSKVRHRFHIYLATGLFKSTKKRDVDEIIEVVKIPIKKAYEMFLTGKEETTSYTILGIMLALNKLKVR